MEDVESIAVGSQIGDQVDQYLHEGCSLLVELADYIQLLYHRNCKSAEMPIDHLLSEFDTEGKVAHRPQHLLES